MKDKDAINEMLDILMDLCVSNCNTLKELNNNGSLSQDVVDQSSDDICYISRNTRRKINRILGGINGKRQG